MREDGLQTDGRPDGWTDEETTDRQTLVTNNISSLKKLSKNEIH